LVASGINALATSWFRFSVDADAMGVVAKVKRDAEAEA